MGQKVHPIGFRLGVTKTWSAQWYADRDYTKLLQEEDRKSTRLNSSHMSESRMPSSA